MTASIPAEAELAALRQSFPLTQRWTRVDHFIDAAHIDGLVIHSVGLLAASGDGADVTGSAAEITRPPVARAYFELIERTALVDFHEQTEVELLKADGSPAGFTERSALFPESTEPRYFRFALSNGVAASPSLQRACTAARGELVERDRVLRSWFGGRAPTRIESKHFESDILPASAYDVEAYSFSGRTLAEESTTEVAGVFAFPKRAGAPFVFGTAAAQTLSEAVRSAERECLQRLAFLWGEPIPEELPSFEASPRFHQDFYLCPHSHAFIRAWLNGNHDEGAPGTKPLALEQMRFANLTPEHLRGRVWVVKAVPGSELQLAFGCRYPGVEGRLQHHGVHPIA